MSSINLTTRGRYLETGKECYDEFLDDLKREFFMHMTLTYFSEEHSEKQKELLLALVNGTSLTVWEKDEFGPPGKEKPAMKFKAAMTPEAGIALEELETMDLNKFFWQPHLTIWPDMLKKVPNIWETFEEMRLDGTIIRIIGVECKPLGRVDPVTWF